MNRSGAASRRFQWVIIAATLLVCFFVSASCTPAAPVSALAPSPIPDKKIISVLIFYRENEKIEPLLKGATVHVYSPQDPVNPDQQWDDDDYDGYYVDSCIESQFIIATAPDFTIENAPCRPDQKSYTIVLSPVPSGDGLNYSGMPAGVGTSGCSSCHNDKYLEWQKDGHGTVFSDNYFGTMYVGMDIFKRLGTATTWKRNSSGQNLREPNNSPYGPGFLLDHPNEQGNCAYCHAPATVQQSRQQYDLFSLIYNYNGPSGDIRTEGVTCDVCHKITGVTLGENQLPFSDRPGILSLSTISPDSNQQIVLGSKTDVFPPSRILMSCSSIYNDSKFCAACHYGKFSDTVIYNSYGEWLNSKFSKKKVNPDGSGERDNSDYRTCQECHMLPPGTVDTIPIAQRTACSMEAKFFKSFDHNMMKYANGGKYNSFADVPLLIEDAATLTVKNEYDANTNSLRIKTEVENVKAGHKFPTDSPLRHLILVLDVRDEMGNRLPQIDGEVIPLWGGVSNSPDDYAGWPGKIYANLLADRDTNISPTAAYWNPTKQMFVNITKGNTSDTRLEPNKPDDAVFVFAVPSSGSVSISVKLIYRYAFIDLARQKGWMRPDVIVTRTSCEVDPTQLVKAECP